MKFKSKSKMFRTLVEKMDIALSEGSSFDEIVNDLKKLHIKVGEYYRKPLDPDLCSDLAKNELESRWAGGIY